MSFFTSIFKKGTFDKAKKQQLKKIQDTDVEERIKQENKTKLINDLLTGNIENELEMLNSIKIYNQAKKEHILTSKELESDINAIEILGLFNKYFTNIIDTLPDGVLIPIPTEFEIDTYKQTLFIGKNIITAGKFYNSESNKTKHSLFNIDKVAFFMNYDKATTLDSSKNNRVQMTDIEKDKIINLIENDILNKPCSNCRFGNIELIFNSWKESTEYIRFIQNSSVITELVKYIPSLDGEIHDKVAVYLNELATELNIKNKEEKDLDFEAGIKKLETVINN